MHRVQRKGAGSPEAGCCIVCRDDPGVWPGESAKPCKNASASRATNEARRGRSAEVMVRMRLLSDPAFLSRTVAGIYDCVGAPAKLEQC
jgi:hypothetical protein